MRKVYLSLCVDKRERRDMISRLATNRPMRRAAGWSEVPPGPLMYVPGRLIRDLELCARPSRTGRERVAEQFALKELLVQLRTQLATVRADKHRRHSATRLGLCSDL
jgi:hypothetical protein